MIPVAEQNAVNSSAVRHVLVVGALELDVEDYSVLQQQHQIRSPLQDFGQVYVQERLDLYAASQLVQQARMILLE